MNKVKLDTDTQTDIVAHMQFQDKLEFLMDMESTFLLELLSIDISA